jgi:hypothetical protein
VHVVFGIGDDVARRLCQFAVIRQPTEKNMRIEQQPHRF